MMRQNREGRGTRPGLHVRECGAVSIEAAGSLILLTAFCVLLASGLAVVGTQLQLVGMAREAARLVSIQPDRAAGEQSLHQAMGARPDLQASLRVRGDFVDVTVARSLQVMRFTTPITQSASATAFRESSW